MEFILVKVNSGGNSVREEVEVVGNDMSTARYENAATGNCTRSTTNGGSRTIGIARTATRIGATRAPTIPVVTTASG
jgi:hypothetical protein